MDAALQGVAPFGRDIALLTYMLESGSTALSENIGSNSEAMRPEVTIISDSPSLAQLAQPDI